MNSPSEASIPNIVLGEEYDKQYSDAAVHYEALGKLANFFGWDMPVHRHSQYLQIHFVENEDIDFHIDDRRYQLSGPCCFLTPATLPHSFKITERAQGHVITIHQSFVWALADEARHNNVDIDFRTGFCIAEKTLSDEHLNNWSTLAYLLESLAKEWQQDAQGKRLAVDNIARLLLITLARLAPQSTEGKVIADDDFKMFRRFSDMLEQHFHEQRPLPYYSRTLGLSESRLNQICQRICQLPPKRLINDRILQEARRLLTHTSLSCNDIAYQLGFSDPAYFSRFFKKHSGCTAKNYRKVRES